MDELWRMPPVRWGYALALAASCAWVVFAWVGRRIRSAALRDDEPRCGRCFYIILPGGSTVCPECGGRLHREGLLTPSTIPPGPLVPLLVLVGVALLPVAALVARPVAQGQPFGWRFVVTRLVYLRHPSQPVFAGPYARITAYGRGRYFGRRVDGIDLVRPQPDPATVDPRRAEADIDAHLMDVAAARFPVWGGRQDTITSQQVVEYRLHRAVEPLVAVVMWTTSAGGCAWGLSRLRGRSRRRLARRQRVLLRRLALVPPASAGGAVE